MSIVVQLSGGDAIKPRHHRMGLPGLTSPGTLDEVALAQMPRCPGDEALEGANRFQPTLTLCHPSFNIIHEQSFGEQTFNRASLNEFHGKKVGDLIDLAGDEPMMPEYEAALRKHLVELNVNELPRIGRDSRKVETLRDILLVLQSEFAALRELTQKTTAATRALQPQIDQSLFERSLREIRRSIRLTCP